jgi:hypothetical protein
MANKRKQNGTPVPPQLSKREHFAGFALAGLLARNTVTTDAPKLAVAAADLLVAELNGRRAGTNS